MQSSKDEVIAALLAALEEIANHNAGSAEWCMLRARSALALARGEVTP